MPSKLCEVTSLEQVTLSQGFVRSSKENVSIKTKLVSTKLTQNVDLMKLLNWKSNQQHIEDTLTKIMNLSGTVEIVKFLQDILDALFAMFSTEDGNSNKYSGNSVFEVNSRNFFFYILFSKKKLKYKLEMDPVVYIPIYNCMF